MNTNYHIKRLGVYLLGCMMVISNAAIAENPWDKRYSDRAEAEDPTITATHTTESPQEAYVITFREVQEAVGQVLVTQGAGDEVRALIARREDSAAATYREPLSLQIDQLTFDKEVKTWQAVAYFSSNNKPLAPIKIAGRYEEVVQVPVLKERVSAGELIAESNVEIKAFGTNRLRGETIESADLLIGKTPKRSISALRPIRVDEVIIPPVIHKGDTINLLYRSNAMEIRTIGQALENGATGDLIKIRNQDSQVVIQATVTGKGTAEITPVASNNTLNTRVTP